MSRLRTDVKRCLSAFSTAHPAQGLTLLTYHRVGGPQLDELDVTVADFAAQVGELAPHAVVSIDEGLRALDAGDEAPRVVLTFDDGFADLYRHAWPRLRDAGLPFVVYLATAYVGGILRWSGSTARDQGAEAISWDQLGEMVESGLCTVGNHTHDHVPPDALDEEQLDRCSDLVRERLGVRPQHFAYPWGIAVERMRPALDARFRSVATGRVGRNGPGSDRLALARVPVRRSDPLDFFRAKLSGGLFAEHTYQALVTTAKRVGSRA